MILKLVLITLFPTEQHKFETLFFFKAPFNLCGTVLWKSNHTAIGKYSTNAASELHIKVMNATNMQWILNVNFKVFSLFFSDFFLYF